MRHRDDDLSPFRDDPLFRALTGPATPDELSGEAEMLTAFRAAVPSGRRRRLAARVGTSGAIAVVALGLSGGAAAAFTNSFPAPAQQVLHEAFGPLGVPAPPHKHHRPHTGPVAEPTRSTVPAPRTTPAATPTVVVSAATSPRAQLTPSATPTALTPSPSTTPTVPIVVGTTTPTPTPTPTPTRLSVAGGRLELTVPTSARVSAGSDVTVSGALFAADGTPLAGRRVVLAERIAGEHGWSEVTVGRTAGGGSVTFTVAAIDRNVRLVLRARHHVRSDVMRVVVTPTITVAVADGQPAADEATVTITVAGAQPGDSVILRRMSRKNPDEQSAQLDANGTVTFNVAALPHHALHYRALVPRTTAHGGAVSVPITVAATA